MDRRNMLKLTGVALAGTSLLSMHDWHEPMERYRGLEFRCKSAEAFIHLRRNNNDLL